jgi:hypothetical protein
MWNCLRHPLRTALFSLGFSGGEVLPRLRAFYETARRVGLQILDALFFAY